MHQMAELQQFQRKVIDLEFKVKTLVILIRWFFCRGAVWQDAPDGGAAAAPAQGHWPPVQGQEPGYFNSRIFFEEACSDKMSKIAARLR